jgi:hypothetical protein
VSSSHEAADDWTSCRYGGADEALHDPRGEPLYNESVYFNFVTGLGDGPLGGIMRIGLRPTDGYAELSLNLPLADGSALFLYQREPLTPAEFKPGTREWTCGQMRLAATVPTRTWQLAYDSSDPRRLLEPSGLGIDPGATLRAAERCPVSIALEFHGRFPLHVLSGSGDIVPGGKAPFARDHYEQFGTVSGTIELDGREFTIDGPGFRDHSWGPRDWQSTPHTNFVTVFARDGSATVAFSARLDETSVMHGVHWSDEGRRPLTAFDVISDYAGGVELHPPLLMVFGLGGGQLRYEATVRSFLPLRHRSGERTVRIGQALFDFEGPSGRAAGWSDLTRPAS